MKKTALIDGDIIVYRISYSNKPKESTEAFSTNGMIERTLDDVKGDVDNFMKFIRDETGCTHFTGFLSAPRKTTFRTLLATIREYKGNRKKGDLPPFFNEIKEYLQSEYGFIKSESYEADDLLASYQSQAEESETIICSIDKDLLQVPGLHWNWNHNETTNVSNEDAVEMLWEQAITGDATDNIEGIPKVGIKTAQKILNPWEQVHYPGVVQAAYIEKFGLNEGIQRFTENFRLVYLLRDLEVTEEPRPFYKAPQVELL